MLDQHSIDTWLTLHWHLGWLSVETQLIFNHCMSWSTLSWLSTHYRLTVDRMSIECQSRCSSSVHWVSMKYQSHVDKDVDWESIEGMDRHSTIDMTWSSGNLTTCPPYHLGISLKTIKWKPENESGSFIVLTELFFFFFFSP